MARVIVISGSGQGLVYCITKLHLEMGDGYVYFYIVI